MQRHREPPLGGVAIQTCRPTAQATSDAFHVISDRQKWVLGYTLERALVPRIILG